MYSISSVQNVNFTSLKSIKYRRAGLKEQKRLANTILGSNKEIKPTLFERFINKFFPKSALNYRLHYIRDFKNTVANI